MEAQTPIGNRSESGQQDFSVGGVFITLKLHSQTTQKEHFSDYEFPSDAGVHSGRIVKQSGQ